MGIGAQELNLKFSLWKEGAFKGMTSVCELGAQDLKCPEGEVDIALSRLTGRPLPQTRDPKAPSSSYSPKILYRELGFTDYTCIDADGTNGSLVMDLNEDLRAKGFDRQFDLVTNYGTSEHVFNQYNCFLNAHNLCKAGGIMIHGVPFQGYLNHGLFNYQPNLFTDLARANGYELLGIYLNPDANCETLAPYTDELMKFVSFPTVAQSTMLLLVALRKITDAPFKGPYDSKYIGASQFKNSYGFQTLPKTYLPLNLGQIGESIPARTLLDLLGKKIRRKLAAWLS